MNGERDTNDKISADQAMPMPPPPPPSPPAPLLRPAACRVHDYNHGYANCRCAALRCLNAKAGGPYEEEAALRPSNHRRASFLSLCVSVCLSVGFGFMWQLCALCAVSAHCPLNHAPAPAFTHPLLPPKTIIQI